MANYLVEGNKTIYCKQGHANSVPFLMTLCKCAVCGCNIAVKFFGVVKDKHGNYAY